jgi:hypothetical protein
MTIIDQWAVQLAKSAVPSEVDLAPKLASAYINYGTCYPVSPGADIDISEDPVAFMPGGMLLLPVVLDAIAAAAQVLRSLLNLSDLKDLIAIVSGALEIRDKARKPDIVQSDIQSEPVSWTDFVQVINIIQGQLLITGLPEEQAELITFRVLKALLSDPNGSREFINCLPERHI